MEKKNFSADNEFPEIYDIQYQIPDYYCGASPVSRAEFRHYELYSAETKHYEYCRFEPERKHALYGETVCADIKRKPVNR